MRKANKIRNINIPIDLCIWVLSHKGRFKTIQLYLFLKHHTSGHFKLTPQFSYFLLTELRISKKTLRRQLNALLGYKLLTHNSISGSYRVIGYEQLFRRLGLSNRTGAIFNGDFTCLKGFMVAAVMSYLAKKKRWVENKPGLTKGNPRKSLNQPYLSLPVTYFAKVLGIPTSTAQYLKTLAVKEGYLKFLKKRKPTGQPSEVEQSLKDYGPYQPDVIFSSGQSLFIRQADCFFSDIKFGRKYIFHKGQKLEGY